MTLKYVVIRKEEGCICVVIRKEEGCMMDVVKGPRYYDNGIYAVPVDSRGVSYCLWRRVCKVSACAPRGNTLVTHSRNIAFTHPRHIP